MSLPSETRQGRRKNRNIKTEIRWRQQHKLGTRLEKCTLGNQRIHWLSFFLYFCCSHSAYQTLYDRSSFFDYFISDFKILSAMASLELVREGKMWLPKVKWVAKVTYLKSDNLCLLIHGQAIYCQYCHCYLKGP